jgi:flagellar biosynthesis/type III secretory pathway protein FliH
MKLTSGFVDSYLALNKEEPKAFEAGLKELATEETEKVMQIVTSWMKDGLKQGRREGRTEGRREGRTEGRREGIEEGQLRAIRGDVLEILQARFSRVPAGLKDALKAIKDRKRLRLLLRQAATVPNLKEFERRITNAA